MSGYLKRLQSAELASQMEAFLSSGGSIARLDNRGNVAERHQRLELVVAEPAPVPAPVTKPVSEPKTVPAAMPVEMTDGELIAELRSIRRRARYLLKKLYAA